MLLTEIPSVICGNLNRNIDRQIESLTLSGLLKLSFSQPKVRAIWWL